MKCHTVHFLQFPNIEFPIFVYKFLQFPILCFSNSSNFQKMYVISVAASPFKQGVIQNSTENSLSLLITNFRVSACAILQFPNLRISNPRISAQYIGNCRKWTVYRLSRKNFIKYLCQNFIKIFCYLFW